MLYIKNRCVFLQLPPTYFFNYCWTSVIIVVKPCVTKYSFYLFLIKFMTQILYNHKCTKMFIKYW